MSTCTNGHGGRRIVALLFNLGDMLMVEESEVKDAEGTTLRAELMSVVASLDRNARCL